MQMNEDRLNPSGEGTTEVAEIRPLCKAGLNQMRPLAVEELSRVSGGTSDGSAGTDSGHIPPSW
jgi:hypothetical protein